MDESATQAVQLGVNVTIFVVSLTLAINLLIGVRNVAETASEYNETIPEGSRVVSVDKENKRTVEGHELLAYYANYMSEQSKVTSSGKFNIVIKNKTGFNSINSEDEILENETLKEFFDRKNINLNLTYEIITEKYDNQEQYLEIVIKEI